MFVPDLEDDLSRFALLVVLERALVQFNPVLQWRLFLSQK